MKEVSEHVPFQLPNKFTRVGVLLTGIASNDAGLQAMMTNIKSAAGATSATSKRHHVELTATYLQPFCLVLKEFPSGTKYATIKISDTTASGLGTKPSARESGVSLRYHTTKEYEALTQPQRDELQEWHNKSKPVQKRKANGS
eukprot:3904376-Ditylum_brightwellii.AAC.1